MADLIRTQCGRIQRQEKIMLSGITLTSYFGIGYENSFSPFVSKLCNLVQKTMGCHSEMFANSKVSNSFNEKLKLTQKTTI